MSPRPEHHEQNTVGGLIKDLQQYPADAIVRVRQELKYYGIMQTWIHDEECDQASEVTGDADHDLVCIDIDLNPAHTDEVM